MPGDEAKFREDSEKFVATHWDSNAQRWADGVRAGRDTYREYYNLPAMVQFLGDLRSLDVLDAGCGEGYWTRILARSGARMTGIDLSRQMIERGRQEERREPLGIRYQVGSYTALDDFGDASFDAVVSFMALMDGPDLSAALRETHRVLRPGGALVFSILHPFFANRRAEWILDGQGRAKALKIGEYFNDVPWVDRWKFAECLNDGPRAADWKLWRKLPNRWKLWRRLPNHWSFFSMAGSKDSENFSIPHFSRTLADYINSVIAAGLVLKEVAEPRPSEEGCRVCPGPQRFRTHAPLFLYLRAVRGE